LRWLQKDLHLAAVSAYETGAAMPLTNAAKDCIAWQFGMVVAAKIFPLFTTTSRGTTTLNHQQWTPRSA